MVYNDNLTALILADIDLDHLFYVKLWVHFS